MGLPSARPSSMSGPPETFADLKAVADQIPSMGGRKIGAWLRQAARDAPSNTSIVEVGCWLGAGTAQLALGIRERPYPKDVSLHCYDRWKATTSEVDKALRWPLAKPLQESARTLPPGTENTPVCIRTSSVHTMPSAPAVVKREVGAGVLQSANLWE